jgi:O-antigen/teichoic acid export membrane protein
MVTAGRLAGGAAWSVAGKLFQFVIGLIALTVIARLVGPEAYGVFALSWVVVGLTDIAVSSAPVDTLVQRRELKSGHCNASFIGALLIALAAWGLITAGADTVAGWLGGGAALAAILPLRAATLPMNAAAAVPTALLMREQRFKAIAVAGAVAGVLASLVGIATALAGAGLWSLVAMELVRQFVLTVLVFRFARWRPGMRASRADAADLVGFNLSTLAAWGLNYLDDQFPRVLIAASLGTEALGFYALAHRLYDQASSILMVPAYQVLMPGMSRVQTDCGAARRLADSMLRAVAVVASPVYLGLAAVSGLLVPLAFGEHWAGAVPVVQVLMLLGIRSSMSMVQMAVVRGMGRPEWHLAAAAVGLILTIALTTAVLDYGLLAVSAGVVVKLFLMWVPYAWFVRRLTGLTAAQQALAALGPTLAALVMAACVFGFVSGVGQSIPAAAALGLSVVLGVAIYLAALSLFAPVASAFVRRLLDRLVRGDLRAVRTMFAGG